MYHCATLGTNHGFALSGSFLTRTSELHVRGDCCTGLGTKTFLRCARESSTCILKLDITERCQWCQWQKKVWLNFNLWAAVYFTMKCQEGIHREKTQKLSVPNPSIASQMINKKKSIAKKIRKSSSLNFAFTKAKLHNAEHYSIKIQYE